MRPHRETTDKIKLERGCEICGWAGHPAALTFDHTDPENKYRTKSGNLVHIADMVKGNRYGLKTILAEIEKCRVLCFNCHMTTEYEKRSALARENYTAPPDEQLERFYGLLDEISIIKPPKKYIGDKIFPHIPLERFYDDRT